MLFQTTVGNLHMQLGIQDIIETPAHYVRLVFSVLDRQSRQLTAPVYAALHLPPLIKFCRLTLQDERAFCVERVIF